jgi:hypothetical protein
VYEKRRQAALQYIRNFVKRARNLIMEINIDNLIEEGGLNPYMVATLGLNTMEEVAELFVYKRVERSLGTSFGNVIEAYLRELLGGRSGKDYPGCSGSVTKRAKAREWICWWDIVLEREFELNGKKYTRICISVKSGPADINKDIVERFIEHAREAEKHGCKPFLVLTYGRRAFTVAESTFRSWGLNPQEYLLVGRDLFKTFLGSSEYYDAVIEDIMSVSTGIGLFDLIEKKIGELTEELKKRYGNDVRRLLKDLS